MKRFFYQYTCLVYSLIQFFLSIAWINAIIEEVQYAKVDNDYGDVILVSVMAFIFMFLSAILDKFIRGIKNEGFWSDCILLTLVSPFRFLFQIITIIRVHIAYNHGNDDFGRRGTDTCRLSSYLYYYLFNAQHEDPRNGDSRVYESKRARQKREERTKVYNEIVEKMERELQEAEHFLEVNRRSDGRYNVYIVPLCSVDGESLYTFSVQNNSYTGERYIDQLYVDGNKIIYDVKFANTISLSLRPGYYSFKIHVTGNVKVIGHTNSEQKVDKTFELKNVYVGDKDVHLCVSMIYGSVVTRYTERYSGKFVKDEFNYFDKNFQFAQVTLSSLKNACDYWNAYEAKITEVETQYSIQKKIQNNRY